MKRVCASGSTPEGIASSRIRCTLRAPSLTRVFVRPPSRWLLLLLSCSVAASACGREPLVVDGEHAEVWVYGEVLAPDGAPIEGVRIEVEARRPEACETSSNVRNSTTTDAVGRYRTVVGQFGARFEVCLHVHASPLESSGLAAVALSRPAVEMRSGAADSVRINLQLAERSPR
jgi:hypothetical protein